MYIFILLCVVVCVLVYDVKMQNSRLYGAVKMYPACFLELPLVGSIYRMAGSSEHVMKKIEHVASIVNKSNGVGRLVGLNNYYIVLTDAPDVAEVLRIYLNKDQMYRFVQDMTGDGSLFNIDASKTKVRRAAIMPSFSSEILGRYVDCTWTESRKLVEALAPNVGRGPFPAGRYLGTFCINTIISAADLKEIHQEFSSEELYDNIYNATQLVSYHVVNSLWMHFLCKFSTTYRRIKRTQSEIHKFTARLDDRAVNEEMMIMLGASDEAAIAMGFTLVLLGTYPAVQEKVHEEFADVFGASDKPLVKDDLISLRYIDCVVKESLRLYPSAPMILRHADKDVTLSSGRVIPAGAGVAVSIFGLHRNPKYWGADAQHFDPERFLPERLAAVPDNAYIPFSYGPRNCPASKFSSHIMKICLCAILRKYKVVGEPASTPETNIRTKFQITMRAVNNFEIELVNKY